MTRFLRMVALAFLLLPTSLVAAQEGAPDPPPCEEGRVRVSERCCWPSQRWSEEQGRCSGAPSCPEPFVEHGDACVARQPNPSPEPTSLPAVTETNSAPGSYPAPPRGYGERWSPDSTEGWPSVRGHEAAPTHRAISARGEDEGLVFTAIAIIHAGWTMGMVGSVMSEVNGCNSSSRRACDVWAWGLLPVAGGMTAGMVALRDNGWAFSFGIPSIIHQGIGLIMLAIALANETTEIVEQPIEGATGLSARLVPGAAGADAGLGLDVTF